MPDSSLGSIRPRSATRGRHVSRREGPGRGRSTIQAEVRSIAELDDSDRQAWAALAGLAQEPNPFFEAPFVEAAAEALGGSQVALLVVREGSDWLACLPIHRPARWRRMPLPVLAAWRHKYCFLSTPLVAADRLDAMSALTGLLTAHHSGVVAFETLSADGVVGPVLVDGLDSDGGRLVVRELAERAILRRRPEPTYLEDGYNGRHRKDLRRTRRRLEEHLGEPLETADHAGDPAAVHDFLALERSGWKGQARTAMGCSPEGTAFFSAICQSFAAQGRLQLLRMSAGGRTVAMKCNMTAGRGIFCFKLAFDEELGRYSPGVQLEVDNVEIFHRRTQAQWMDSCADPGNEMINRLWPDRRPILDLALRTGDPRGWASGAAIRAASTLRARIRKPA